MRIFISHSYKDIELADRLSLLIEKQGHEIVKYDTVSYVDSNTALKNNIKKLLKESDAMILLYTENSTESNWVNFEFAAFAEYSKLSNNSKAIFPVIIGDIAAPSYLDSYRYIKASPKDIDSVALKILTFLSKFQGELIAKEEQANTVKERIERSSADYVQETLSRLESRERSLNKKASIWYIIGYTSLVLSIIIAGLFTIFSSLIKSDNWLGIALLGLKSAVIIVLLIASSKYCFNLAKTYMNESLKNSDRIHAISFGKFYLQIFGNSVDSKDVKEVFGDWNLDKQSNFLKMDSNDYDPHLIELIIKTIETIKDKKGK